MGYGYYSDTYIEWLDNCEKDQFGWPTFVTEEAREWLVQKIRNVISEHGPLPIRRVYELTWREAGPPCLRKVALWDAILGITYRALLAADAEQV